MKKLFAHTTLLPQLLLALCLFNACIQEDVMPNTPQGNFDELWRIIDENYCFFDYKNIDWDAVGEKYREKTHPHMIDRDLFQTMGNMLDELQDGHVNLYNENMQASSYIWHADYPCNYNEWIIDEFYLKYSFLIVSGIKFDILEQNIGYMYVPNFTDNVSSRDLDYIFRYFASCTAIIVDVRSNGGGSISNASRLAARFFDRKRLTGHIIHKTGKSHNAFSSPQPIHQEPATSLRSTKPVAVLTNRQTFSAANEFVNRMQALPYATIVGDITGGGSGLPFYSELPNGWAVRFSCSPLLNADLQHTEFGIAPHVKVDITTEDEAECKDTILDTAIQLLLSK